MKVFDYLLPICLMASMSSGLVSAQQAEVSQSAAVVPRLVNFSGRAVDLQGKPIAGIAGVTFAIYNEQYEGTPLWTEAQNVAADSRGNYSAQLGATTSAGLPLELFSSGEARWLGVRINGGEELPRVFLLSVPYAFQAANAQTLGGLPPSAFVMAPVSKSSAVSNGAAPPASTVTGSGTANLLPRWTGTNQIGNSDIFDSNGKVGIDTTTPTAKFDVKGTARIRGTADLDGAVTAHDGVTGLSTGAATAGVTGQNSVGGYGLLGTTTGSSGQGVWGESFGTTFTNAGPDGVHGVAHSNQGSGVAGLNTDTGGIGTYGQGEGYGVYGVAVPIRGLLIAGGVGVSGSSGFGSGVSGSSTSGAGVYGSSGSGAGVSGSSSTGPAFYAAGNVEQTRTGGGWAKAMLFYDGATGTIKTCFNSTQVGTAATQPPCGLYVDKTGTGDYILDFGFEVDDRFLSMTPWIMDNQFVETCTNGIAACDHTLTGNQVEIIFTDQNFNFQDNKFFLIVY